MTILRKLIFSATLLALSCSAAGAVPLLSNGSFENPSLGREPQFYPLWETEFGGWIFSRAAVANTNVERPIFHPWYGPWGEPVGFDGLQFAVITGSNNSYFSQVFINPYPTWGNISWLEAGAHDDGFFGGNAKYDVFLNDLWLGRFSTEHSQPFTSIIVENIYLPEGQNTLRFVSLVHNHTAFIDNVTVEAPEPLTLSLFGAGLAGAVALTRRKKKL